MGDYQTVYGGAKAALSSVGGTVGTSGASDSGATGAGVDGPDLISALAAGAPIAGTAIQKLRSAAKNAGGYRNLATQTGKGAVKAVGTAAKFGARAAPVLSVGVAAWDVAINDRKVQEGGSHEQFHDATEERLSGLRNSVANVPIVGSALNGQLDIAMGAASLVTGASERGRDAIAAFGEAEGTLGKIGAVINVAHETIAGGIEGVKDRIDRTQLRSIKREVEKGNAAHQEALAQLRSRHVEHMPPEPQSEMAAPTTQKEPTGPAKNRRGKVMARDVEPPALTLPNGMEVASASNDRRQTPGHGDG